MSDITFPFGTYFKVQKRKSSKVLIPVPKNNFLNAIEKAKTTLQKIGEDQGHGGYLVQMVNEKYTGFGVSKPDAKVECFFWNYLDTFAIEVVNRVDKIPDDEIPRVPKLFLVLKPEAPYYYHYQKRTILTTQNITDGEKIAIQRFEEGLGTLHDYEV